MKKTFVIAFALTLTSAAVSAQTATQPAPVKQEVKKDKVKKPATQRPVSPNDGQIHVINGGRGNQQGTAKKSKTPGSNANGNPHKKTEAERQKEREEMREFVKNKNKQSQKGQHKGQQKRQQTGAKTKPAPKKEKTQAPNTQQPAPTEQPKSKKVEGGQQ